MSENDFCKEFSLESILSVLTGYNFCTDFLDVYKLYWFVFKDNLINDSGLLMLKKVIKNHILEIHPELSTVRFNDNDNLNEWLNKRKIEFGDKLLISIINHPLEEETLGSR